MGKIRETFGEVCRQCEERINSDFKACVECFIVHLIPIEDGYCPKCLDPRPAERQTYPHCYTCKMRMDKDEYYLDGVLSCSYFVSNDTDFGFSLHTYKGSGMRERHWMTFPLQALALEFLSRHLDCIISNYGHVDAIVPVPGHAEKLLPFKEYNDIPVFHCLTDTRENGRQSTGGKREFSSTRFEVIGDSIPETLILFDDVLTQSVTANSASFTLKANGAQKIILLTLGKRLGYTQQYLSDNPQDFDIDECIFCKDNNF